MVCGAGVDIARLRIKESRYSGELGWLGGKCTHLMFEGGGCPGLFPSGWLVRCLAQVEASRDLGIWVAI